MTEASALRKQVAERAKHCCEYCQSQEKFATHRFSVEHIIPISKGGQTHLDNLAYACQGCNNYKYTKTAGLDPVSSKLADLYHPRQHRWNTYFAWNEDCSQIIGLTPTGRATVKTLQLNRTTVVNLRRVLYAMNEHPPA